jgi:hypothetical protein
MFDGLHIHHMQWIVPNLAETMNRGQIFKNF